MRLRLLDCRVRREVARMRDQRWMGGEVDDIERWLRFVLDDLPRQRAGHWAAVSRDQLCLALHRAPGSAAEARVARGGRRIDAGASG